MNGSNRELTLNKRGETPRALPFESSSLTHWLSRWGLIVAEFGMVQVGVQALLAVAEMRFGRPRLVEGGDFFVRVGERRIWVRGEFGGAHDDGA